MVSSAGGFRVESCGKTVLLIIFEVVLGSQVCFIGQSGL